MQDIRSWWRDLPGERWWLGVVRREGNRDLLATPCSDGDEIPAWRRRLITGIRPGDAVFHFDSVRQEIVAWSTTRGRVREQLLDWDGHSQGPGLERAQPRKLPTWTVELESATPLDAFVSLDRIARIQSEMFLELRSLEDQVGEPLYYPFAVGSPAGTELLQGHVFKLPSLFVSRFPSMARVAELVSWTPDGARPAKSRARLFAPAAVQAAPGSPAMAGATSLRAAAGIDREARRA